MNNRDGQGGPKDPTNLSEDPTIQPFGRGTATHASVSEAGFSDPTASAFATTRKVSTQALRELVRARHGSDDSAPHLPPVSAEFLERLRRVRRQGMDAEGMSFGRYTVFGLIGLGGMAQIRLAAEALAGDGIRLVVIKSLLPEHAGSQAYRDLLVEEGRICAHLHHPNIVRLFDQGEIDGIPYLAFELIDGLSLRDLVRLIEPARLPLSCILEIGAQAAAGLAHAHTALGGDGRPLNVVHRDVTPHNVLVNRQGEIKLVDFGIARFVGRQLETQHGQLRGKLGYMAPEQCRTGPIDGRADVFALSLTLTELIAGRRVLPPTLMILQESESLIQTACADAVEAVPEALEALLIQMAAIRAEDRPWPTSEVARTLTTIRGAVSGPTLAEFTAQRVFSRLLPIDFPSMTDSPTRRVMRVAPSEAPEPVPDEDRYASTVRRLRPAPAELRPATPPPLRVEDSAPKPTPAAAETADPPGASISELAADLMLGASPTLPPTGPWARAMQAPLPPDLDPDQPSDDLDVAQTRRVSPASLPPEPTSPSTEPTPTAPRYGLWLAGAAALAALAAALTIVLQ